MGERGASFSNGPDGPPQCKSSLYYQLQLRQDSIFDFMEYRQAV